MILVVGVEEQLQFQPPARDRRGGGHAVLSDRRRQRARSRHGCAARRWSGLTAGASAPEELVQDVIEALREIDGDFKCHRWTG